MIHGASPTAEYFDDTGCTMPSSFFATRSEVVEAGLTRSFTDTPRLAKLGDAHLRLCSLQAWALHWNEWVSVTQVGAYTVSVVADDGVAVALASVRI